MRNKHCGLRVVRPHSPPLQRAGAVMHPTVTYGTVATSEKIENWLQSFEEEEKRYKSFTLYCEMMLQQSAVLTEGKEYPNRLRTAIALHCLHRAVSVFGRYQSIMRVIWR